MVITKFGVEYKQLPIEYSGNVFWKNPDSKENIERLIKQENVNGFIEPNYGQTSTLLEVNTLEIANALDPWCDDYIKCDALKVSVDFLKKNHFALFARSADCLMLTLVSKKDIYLLHLSAESINNGILKHLQNIDSPNNYYAIEGPCISEKNYYLYGDKFISEKTSNYAKYGYMEHTHFDDMGLHIDLRGIARDSLTKCGISTVIKDHRCTFSDSNLGSNRRQGRGPDRFDNVIIIK